MQARVALLMTVRVVQRILVLEDLVIKELAVPDMMV
jgi:hypothetical protein